MRPRLALVVIAALLSACTWRAGQWLERYGPASSAAGLTARVWILAPGATPGAPGEGEELLERRGELLAVEEGGLLFRQRDTIFRIHYPRIDLATFPDRQTIRLQDGEPPAPAAADTLRLLSRFPGGVDDALMRRLLDAYGQREVVEVRAADEPPPGPSPAAVSRDSLEAFVSAVREATVRFHDQRVAIREGYRKLGPDFPAMGEHWIQPGLVIDGEVDPARPPVLSYATLEGRVTLTGVAYTLPLGPGEEAPPFLGRSGVWHDHSSGVDEESLLLNHGSHEGHGGHARRGGPRLAMVHVWTWTENPDGMLAQYNWALPYLRLGLPVPPESPAAARRALSLAAGGADYYAALLEAAADARPEERTRFRRVLTAHAQRVEAWVAEARAREVPPTPRTLDPEPLTRIWRSLWDELEAACGPGTRNRLAELRGALEG